MLLAEGYLNLPSSSDLLHLFGGFICVVALIILFVVSMLALLVYLMRRGQRRDESDRED